MAAKLVVSERGVFLGAFRLAAFYRDSNKATRNYVIADGTHHKSKRYEVSEDCEWDAESEVRRLLKEAGVEVES